MFPNIAALCCCTNLPGPTVVSVYIVAVSRPSCRVSVDFLSFVWPPFRPDVQLCRTVRCFVPLDITFRDSELLANTVKLV
jgi:hypothetical protein